MRALLSRENYAALGETACPISNLPAAAHDFEAQPNLLPVVGKCLIRVAVLMHPHAQAHFFGFFVAFHFCTGGAALGALEQC